MANKYSKVRRFSLEYRIEKFIREDAINVLAKCFQNILEVVCVLVGLGLLFIVPALFH